MLVGQYVALVADKLDTTDPFDAFLVVQVDLTRLFLLRLELDECSVAVSDNEGDRLLRIKLHIAKVGTVERHQVALDDSVAPFFVHEVPGKDLCLRRKQQLLMVSGVERESDAGFLLLHFGVEDALLLHAPVRAGDRVTVVNDNVGHLNLTLDQAAANADTDSAVVP